MIPTFLAVEGKRRNEDDDVFGGHIIVAEGKVKSIYLWLIEKEILQNEEHGIFYRI